MPIGDKPCPYSIPTLLTCTYDIFGENDPVRRRAAIDETTEDCVFYEPGGGA
jgi:hypothetical protein